MFRQTAMRALEALKYLRAGNKNNDPVPIGHAAEHTGQAQNRMACSLLY